MNLFDKQKSTQKRLGKLFRELRKDRDLSQVKAGANVGISRQRMVRIETATAELGFLEAVALLQQYGWRVVLAANGVQVDLLNELEKSDDVD